MEKPPVRHPGGEGLYPLSTYLKNHIRNLGTACAVYSLQDLEAFGGNAAVEGTSTKRSSWLAMEDSSPREKRYAVPSYPMQMFIKRSCHYCQQKNTYLRIALS